MKLGEKLQQLRKKSGLSQEQLAAQLTVSRQAVSKWELDETMPDTENVVQLSRIFGVSCDYLLRDEVDEQGAAQPADPGEGGASTAPGDRHSPRDVIRLRRTTVPAAFGYPANDRSGGASAAPGETHLTEQGWTHNAFALSLGVCAIGLVVAFMSRINGHTLRPLVIGFAIQVLGLALFELATPRMGSGRNIARLNFYRIACWLVLPVPQILIFGWIFDDLLSVHISPIVALLYYYAAYLLAGAFVMVILTVLRRRMADKT